jgi:hypothetical protein
LWLHSGIFATTAQKTPFTADPRMIAARLGSRLIPDSINDFSERGFHARFGL